MTAEPERRLCASSLLVTPLSRSPVSTPDLAGFSSDLLMATALLAVW
jgi:hypothetical protein